ncbi:unnamed protein product [Albugo candida]|uniref:Uncharacterized protein n=1 Tax=Albugo candida TaxID=65357 RepID=A0A024GVD0_9STRA|nr:unnamed protein product [Albugo candida]|eukprot:CCI50329.1 unnamed protein product [Albugo candida]
MSMPPANEISIVTKPSLLNDTMECDEDYLLPNGESLKMHIKGNADFVIFHGIYYLMENSKKEAYTSERHQKASSSPVYEPDEKLESSESQPAEESKQAQESQPASWKIVRSNNKRSRSLTASKACSHYRCGIYQDRCCDQSRVRKRYHIVPINVLVPKDVATSKEAAHFFTKKHTKIVKDSRPTRVGEVVVNLLTEDLLTAQIPTKPDRLLQAEIHVFKAEKHLGFTSNGDSLLQFAFNHPIALHGVLNKGVRFE